MQCSQWQPNTSCNVSADSRAKTASKKQPNTQLSLIEIQQGNKMLKANAPEDGKTQNTKYNDIVPSISHKKLALRVILLKNTSRKGISKFARLKTQDTHSTLNTETSPECSTCKVKEPPEHFLLNFTFSEQAKLEKNIKKIFYKNNCQKLNITIA